MKVAIIGPEFGFGGANLVAEIVGEGLHAKQEVHYIAYEKDNAAFHARPYYFVGKQRSAIQQVLQKIDKGLRVALRHEFVPSHYLKDEVSATIAYIQAQHIDKVILNSYIAVTLFAEPIKNQCHHIEIIGWLHEAVEYCKHLTRHYRPSFKRGVVACDQIVVLSKESLDYYHNWQPNIQVIYNPVQLPTHGLSALTKPVISFTARLSFKVKGLDYLCEVAANLPEGWKIRVAGQGTPDEIAEFRKVIDQYSVTNKLQFVGELHGDALAKHYQESSIFLSTSRTEALPLVMIEALSFGLPIVSFDHSGAKEILEHGQDGILSEVGDVSGLVDGIQKLIDNPEERQMYQQKSINRYQAFQLTTVLSRWERVLS